LAGCGLGSQISQLAVRTGFAHFILIDNDKVEKSNLNRQAFRQLQIGENKAIATANLIREVNPEVEIEVYPYRLNSEKTLDFIKKADVIVNLVDPDKTMYALNENAQQNQKPVFFPLNVGFGGFLMIFTHSSSSLEKILGRKIIGNEFYFQLLERVFSPPPYLKNFYQEWGQFLITGTKPLPQLGIASLLTSSLTITAITLWLKGEKLKEAPELITIDPIGFVAQFLKG